MTPICTRAGGNGQRQNAQHKGNGGHQDGTEPQAASFQRGVDQVVPLILQIAGELNDQYRILRRESDDDDQPDLEVNIVGQAA